MKHTEGNWIYSEYTPTDFGVYSETGSGNDIALVRGSGEESEANAKLIAAAPDLLLACKNALTDIDAINFIIKDKVAQESIKLLTEAINKATL